MRQFTAGLAVGSVVTAAACYYLCRPREENKRDSFAAAVATSYTQRRVGDLEHTNFISNLVDRLWVKLGPAIGDTIKTAVEPMFKDLLPSIVSDLHFTKCDFGKIPIKFDNFIIHPILNGTTIHIDTDVSWDGACDIQLKSNSITLGVRNIKLFGRMKIVISPLTNELPCIGAIQYAFINKPTLELDFTGLANLADVSGIDKMIRNILDDVIAGLMVLPARMVYKMDPCCDFRGAFKSPVGVARITAIRGRVFKVEKRGLLEDDIPDVYLKMTLGTMINLERRTSVQENTLTPEWNESFDFLLSDADQVLKIHAWDEDKGTLDADDDLGVAKVTIADILTSPGKVMEVELLNEANVGTGTFITIHCDVGKLKADPKCFHSPPPPNNLAGLLTIIVTKAFNLPLSKEEAESFVKVKFGQKEFFTGIVVDCPDYPGFDCLNPIYDVSFLVPIDRELVENLPDIEFELLNGWEQKTLLGSIGIPCQTLLEASESTFKETRSIGSGGALLEFQVSLLGFETVNSPLSSSIKPQSYLRPLESTDQSINDEKSNQDSNIITNSVLDQTDDESKKVKITMVSGQCFKIKKRKFRKDDIPDMYCIIKFGSSPNVWRTATIKDDVNPAWNESRSFALSSQNQVISIDAWDENKKGEDTFVGSVRIAVGKVLLNSGKMELELENEGSKIGSFVNIACELD